MPALITGVIPKQGFEKVRDAIGAILVVELENQKLLQGGSFPEDVKIFTERITPIDNEEPVYINILLDSATYSQKTQADSQGATIYFIDVYTTGEGSNSKSGSTDSSFRLHRFMGMIRYILSSTFYNTLDLPAGLIGGTLIETLATLDPMKQENSEFTRFGRLQYSVRIQESQELWEGINLVDNDTEVKLELTEKGYQYRLAS